METKKVFFSLVIDNLYAVSLLFIENQYFCYLILNIPEEKQHVRLRQ